MKLGRSLIDDHAAGRGWLASAMRYALAVAAVVLAALITIIIQPLIAPSLTLLFFPAVVVAALYCGRGPALLATVLSTIIVAFFFIPPAYSFDLGLDDVIRLVVFLVVALITASISSARKRADDALRRSLADLRGLHDTLQQVREWPAGTGLDTATAVQAMLRRAAGIIDCARAVVVWEDEEEPLVCVARSAAGADADAGVLSYYPPGEILPVVPEALLLASFATAEPFADDASVLIGYSEPASRWRGRPIGAAMQPHLGTDPVASAPFRTEHLDGRMFFCDVPVDVAVLPRVELVAREIGTSLEQLRVAEQMRAIAARNERARVARDLHDGTLQSLMGVRLELQTLRRTEAFTVKAQERLDMMDDVLAREQKDLRSLIDETRFVPAPAAEDASLDDLLQEIAARLRAEWRTPIVIRVAPSVWTIPPPMARPLQLMVQEGIVNAVKHGHPSQVTVEVESGESEIRLAIVDDGRGFPFSGRFEHETLVRRSLGPASLRDRATALGGTIAIESGRMGTRVELTLPVRPSSHARTA